MPAAAHPLAICREDQIAQAVTDWRADGVILAISPGRAGYRRPARVPYSVPHSDRGLAGRDSTPVLCLYCHDIETPYAMPWRAPDASHVRLALSFRDEIVAGTAGGRILIACRAALSRSPALALALAMPANPVGEAGRDPISDHVEAAARACAALVKAAPWCQPNRLILEIADRLLTLDGALTAAAAAAFTYPPRAPHGAMGEPGHFAALRPQDGAAS